MSSPVGGSTLVAGPGQPRPPSSTRFEPPLELGRRVGYRSAASPHVRAKLTPVEFELASTPSSVHLAASHDLSQQPSTEPAAIPTLFPVPGSNYGRISTGTPKGSIEANSSITSLWTRMHPCETSVPSRSGWFVP